MLRWGRAQSTCLSNVQVESGKTITQPERLDSPTLKLTGVLPRKSRVEKSRSNCEIEKSSKKISLILGLFIFWTGSLGLTACTQTYSQPADSGQSIGQSENSGTGGGINRAETSAINNNDPQEVAKRSLKVVTTTGILADLVANVLGERGTVKALVPPGADPHSYEPSLRDVRDIAYADLAFSNYLLLEEQGIIRTIVSNLPAKAEYVEVAERSTKHGANLIPLVEDPSLNTIWLGMRIRGEGKERGLTKTSQVGIAATGLRYESVGRSEVSQNLHTEGGQGQLSAFLTGTFGQPEPYFNSRDGFVAGSNYAYSADSLTLPVNAHTHMSWAFSEPGVYRLDLAGSLTSPLNFANSLAHTTITFAVGVDPHKVPGLEHATVLSKGHMDIALDVEQARLYLWGDRQDGRPGDQAYDPATTVVWVPNAALNQIPANPAYRFMGKPGADAYVLAQAVLGKHVHGEIDPHLWQSVPNAQAYVKVIRDALSKADPLNAAYYAQRAQSYLALLDDLDHYVQETIDDIPASARQLVTTHDAYGYLGARYGLNIAGFVTPNPALEPSTRDMIALTNTVASLQVPAVFLEPNAVAHAGELRRVAGSQGVRVCTIYGDSFTPKVNTYVKLMAQNAYNLKVCLDPQAAPPPRFIAAEKETESGKNRK